MKMELEEDSMEMEMEMEMDIDNGQRVDKDMGVGMGVGMRSAPTWCQACRRMSTHVDCQLWVPHRLILHLLDG